MNYNFHSARVFGKKILTRAEPCECIKPLPTIYLVKCSKFRRKSTINSQNMQHIFHRSDVSCHLHLAAFAEYFFRASD